MSLSNLLHALAAWVAAHPGVAAYVGTTLVAVYRSKTPAQWVALGESLPRLQGLFKMARGGGFDPTRVLEGAEQVATGRRVPDPRELVISSQARRIEELEATLAIYQRRVTEAQATTAPIPRTAEEMRSQQGSASFPALCLAVALIALVVRSR